MTDDKGRPLIPLREALYGGPGSDGLFPFVTRRDARKWFSKIWNVKSPYSPVRKQYVLQEEYSRLFQQKRATSTCE